MSRAPRPRSTTARSDHLGGTAAIPRAVPTVRSAVQYLERNAGDAADAHRCGRRGAPSPSRLTHLFTQEAGIPFPPLRAVGCACWCGREHVAAGSDLTRAAVAAGFSDSAHLSRVFKRNFGLTPSALLGMTVDRDAWPTGGPTGADPA